MRTKKCCTCKEIKNIDEFNANKNAKDGLDARCRDCNREYLAQYRKDKPLEAWANHARSNNRREGKPILVDVAELVKKAKITVTDELTGLPLIYGANTGGKKTRSSASIDHICPEIPGIIENIGYIRDPFNSAKSNWDIPQLTLYMHTLWDNRDQLRWYFNHEYEPIELLSYKKNGWGKGKNWRYIWAGSTQRSHLKNLTRNHHLDLWQIDQIQIYSIAAKLDYCEMCGQPIYYYGEVPDRVGKSSGGLFADTASFDRIDIHKPYTISNIGIICGQCNRFKGIGNLQEILVDLKAYLKQEDDLVAEYHKRAIDLRKNYVMRGNPQRRIDDFDGADLQLG